MANPPNSTATPDELRKMPSWEIVEELSLLPNTNAKPYRLREIILQVRNAEASEKYSRALIFATWVLVALTVVLLVKSC